MERIILLIEHAESRHRIERALQRENRSIRSHDTHLPPIPEEPLDLVIIDSPTLEQWENPLRARKEAEAPILLPVLLILDCSEMERVARHLGATVDELLCEPITPLELETRVEALLTLRRLSIESASRHPALARSDLTGETIEETQQLAENIIAAMHEPLVVLDADLRVVLANNAFYRTFQVTPEETEGRLLYDLGNRQWDIPELRRLLEEILPQNTALDHFEVHHDFPGLGWRSMLLNARRIDRAAHIAPRILLTIEDITEQVQVEHGLHRALREWMEIFEAIGRPTFILDPHYTVIAANQAAAEATGKTADELVGMHCYELLHDGDEPAPGCPMERMLRSGHIETAEVQAFGGTFLVSCTPAFNAQGELEKVIHIATDITERVRAQETWQESEERYRLQFEYVSDVVYSIDPQFRLLDISPSVEKTLGYRPAELIGRPFTELNVLAPESLEQALADTMRVLAGESIESSVYRFIARDGRTVWAEINGAPLIRDGQVVALVSVARDITERMRRERMLEAEAMLAQAVGESLELRPLLERLLAAARHAVPTAEKGSVMLLEPDGRLRIYALDGYEDPRLTDLVLTDGSGYAVRVARERRPLLISDAPGSPETAYNGEIEEARNIRSAVAVPLMVRDQPVGVISLDSTHKSAFTERDLHTLNTFATPAALILENTRLFAETHRRGEEATALWKTAQALNHLDLETTLRTIGEHAKALFAADGCRIFMLEPDGETLRCVLALHDRAEAVLRLSLKLGQGVTGDIALRGEPAIVNDMLADPHVVQVPGTPVRNEAMMFVPLKERGERIGIISISRLGTERPFHPHDLELFKAFAAITTSAIVNARLFEETQQRLAELSALHKASQQLLAARLDPEKTYSATHQAVQEMMPCEAFVIVLDDPQQEGHQAVYLYDKGGHYLPRRVPQGQGLSGWVISHRQTLLVNDFPAESGEWSAIHFGDEETVRSILAVPLRRDEQIVGMISAQSYRPHVYNERHQVLLETLAAQLGATLENVYLHQQTQQHLREVELMIAIGEALRTANRRADVLSVTGDQLFERMEIEGAAIGVLDLDSGALLIEHGRGVWAALTGVTIPANEGISKQVLETGEPYLSYDLRNVPSLFQPDLLGDCGCRAVAGVPMVAAGQTIGLLWIAGRRPFGEDDMRLLRIIGDVASNAIRRATLQEQLEDQARQMAQIMATVPEGVLLLDGEGRVLEANPAAEKYLILLAGARVGEILTHIGNRPLAELLTSPPTKGLWHEIHDDGRTFEVIARPMEDGPKLKCWVLVIKEVTHERQIRTQMEQQERLAAVGQLAAGIAHDFNNIIATIVLYARLLERTTTLSEQEREHLKVINQQAWHASRLIEQVLDFSRRSVLEQRPLDLLPLVKEHVKLLERTLPEHIEITLRHGEEDYTVHADPTRIQQVLTNLALNARDAMPDGGYLRITLDRIALTAGVAPPMPEMAPGDWVVLGVTDTGVGIPADVLPHIFEPFFTTKTPGEGSGLGLAQIYGIVGQHGGHIQVMSQEGKGTTFIVYLPALRDVPDTASWSQEVTAPQGHGEVILVVEDDMVLRAALVDSLKLLNYQVLEASNGKEALARVQEHREQIALVLSDVVMPAMGGIALFHALQEQGWHKPMILLTGHPVGKELEALQDQGLSAWMGKPPSLEQLSQALADALRQVGEGT